MSTKAGLKFQWQHALTFWGDTRTEETCMHWQTAFEHYNVTAALCFNPSFLVAPAAVIMLLRNSRTTQENKEVVDIFYSTTEKQKQKQKAEQKQKRLSLEHTETKSAGKA